MKLRRGATVSWSELIRWAKAHGAENDALTDIRIGWSKAGYGTVTFDGFSRNSEGQYFTTSLPNGDKDAARWSKTVPLRFLP